MNPDARCTIASVRGCGYSGLRRSPPGPRTYPIQGLSLGFRLRLVSSFWKNIMFFGSATKKDYSCCDRCECNMVQSVGFHVPNSIYSRPNASAWDRSCDQNMPQRDCITTLSCPYRYPTPRTLEGYVVMDSNMSLTQAQRTPQ